jgi:hypothetical protein
LLNFFFVVNFKNLIVLIINTGVKKKTLNKYGVKAGGLGSLFSGGITFELKKRSQPSPENSSGSEEKHQTASVPTLRKTSASSVSTLKLRVIYSEMHCATIVLLL